MVGTPERMIMTKNVDREAFREFVDAHKRRVFCLAYDLTGNVDDAEDLSQEVFIRAYRHLREFRGDCAPSTWLHTITVRTWIDLRRTRNARVHQMSVPIEEELTDYQEASWEHPESRAEGALIRGHIEHALDSLSPRERSIFSLKFFQDLKLGEIASTLSISEGSVKNHLYNAVRKMRKKLAFLLDRR